MEVYEIRCIEVYLTLKKLSTIFRAKTIYAFKYYTQVKQNVFTTLNIIKA